jgi:16S rRNA (guanine(527)-N(7))-methyltransferase RsmG
LEWNEKVNVTGAKTPLDLANKHIADAFLAWKTLNRRGRPIFDVGSGGGIPGLVLALLDGDAKVTLVERRQKKAAVLSEIVSAMRLGGRVQVVCRSFEELPTHAKEAENWFRGFLPGQKLGVYLSQAFPTGRLGPLVLMKGPAWPTEKAELLALPKLREIWKQRFSSAVELKYSLPHSLGERILVVV